MVTEKGRSGNGRRDDGEDDALAALQAHFTNTFGSTPIKAIGTNRTQNDFAQAKSKVKKAKRKVEEVAPILATAGPSRLPHKTEPETIVFDGTLGQRSGSSNAAIPTSDTGSSGGWRKFMSGKVATSKDKVDEEAQEVRLNKMRAKAKRIGGANDDEEEERQMVSNDRALSQLLSSTLFAPDTQEAQRKAAKGKPVLSSNATLSRIMELSQPSLTGEAKSVGRGLGTSLVKAAELGKMPSSMRHGIRKAHMEKQAEELENAKELGLYHQSIKGLLGKGAEGGDLVQGSRDKDRRARSRQKGLSMGVGRFSNGALRLSQEEVQRINASGSGTKRRKR